VGSGEGIFEGCEEGNDGKQEGYVVGIRVGSVGFIDGGVDGK